MYCLEMGIDHSFIDESEAIDHYISDVEHNCSLDFATIDRIRNAAERMHSKVIEGKNLELKTQFRVTGGETYISFIKSFLGYHQDVSSYHPDKYEFKVFDSASDMQKAIVEKDNLYSQNLHLNHLYHLHFLKNKVHLEH